MSVSLPRFPFPYACPDSSFYRGSGAPPEIEALYIEWANCIGTPGWEFSSRGIAVDVVLERWELEQGR